MTAQEARELTQKAIDLDKPKVYSEEENNNLDEFYFHIKNAAEKGESHCTIYNFGLSDYEIKELNKQGYKIYIYEGDKSEKHIHDPIQRKTPPFVTLAWKELCNRGKDANGLWVGFNDNASKKPF